MSEHIDGQGEVVVHGAYPPALAAAIVKVMEGTRRLGKDARNPQGGYGYVSVDKMYEFVGQLMAEAGLAIIIDEESCEVQQNVKEGKASNWLFMRWRLYFLHREGAVSPPVYRSVMVLANGPQAYGSAQSYVEKQFMRQVFKVPTGDKDDADLHTQEEQIPARTAPTPHRAAAAGNGAASPERERMKGIYDRLRQQIATAPRVDILETALEDATTDLAALKGYSEQHYNQLMASAAKRKEMLAQPAAADDEPLP